MSTKRERQMAYRGLLLATAAESVRSGDDSPGDRFGLTPAEAREQREQVAARLDALAVRSTPTNVEFWDYEGGE